MAPLPGRAPGASVWEPGTTVGRFTLVTTLAQGGMAEIWLARQSGLKGFAKLMVIKRMMHALHGEAESVEMFLTEARLAAQLSHPNVVQISELGDEAGSLYIVMEYLDGEDLTIVRRTGQKHGQPIPDHLAVRLISQAAEGLHYAHTLVGHDGKALRIVHRDISPQNLIVTFDGGIKIVDFGIAKAASAATHSGKLKGKLGYMSPEQARGEALDGRSDVYALGIVLFEVVTRSRLLPKMNDLEMLDFMAGDARLPEPSERRRDLPPGLEPIIIKAMQRKAEDRYQSAREFHEALEGWLRTCGKSASSADVADYLRSVFTRRIHDRRQLIEAATTADLTPTSALHLAKLSRRTGSGSQSMTRATGSHSRGLVAGVVAMSLLVLAMGVAVARRAMASDEGPPKQDVSAPVEPPKPKTIVVVTQPPPRPTVLVVETQPSGAVVTVDGIERGPSPVTLDPMTLGPHDVVAKQEGFEPLSRTITLEESGERRVIELALKEAAKAPEPIAAVVPEKPTKPEKVTKKKTPSRRPAAAPKGKLTLKTAPWSTVYLGKRKLGDTPLVNMALPAGVHTLRLVTPDTGKETTIEVEITANQTTVKKLSL